MKTRLLHAAALALIAAYMAPYFLAGQSAHVTIFDQLDSVLVDLKVLVESRSMLAPAGAKIENFAGGMPRSSFPSGLSVLVWLTYWFGAFGGFVAASLLMRLVAYWGMYRLLTQHVLRETASPIPAVCASLAFALLPFYPLFGLSIAGQPLFFSALLNIRAGPKTQWRDWLILIAFPFFSALIYGGIFLLAVAAGLWIFDAAVRKAPSFRFAAAIAATAIAHLVVEFQSVASLLGGGQAYLSHRVEFEMAVPSLTSSLSRAWGIFKAGHEHAASIQYAYVFPLTMTIVLLPIAFAVARSDSANSRRSTAVIAVLIYATLGLVIYFYDDRLPPLVLAGLVAALIATLVRICRLTAAPFKACVVLLCWLAAASLAIALWYAYWPLAWRGLKSLATGLPYVNLARLHYLHPTLWYVLFALALAILTRRLPRAGPLLALVVVTLQVHHAFQSSQNTTERKAGNPSYREFFSANLFDDIARYLGRDKREFRVASIGMHPSIAAYNGFHTVDGYSASYPLEYKHRFRRIIAGELARNPSYRDYFDKWGSRYYIFCHELEPLGADAFLMTRSNVAKYKARITDLAFDTQAFHDLGGRFVISALEIENAPRTGLELLRTFRRDDSPWTLYLYRTTLQKNSESASPTG